MKSLYLDTTVPSFLVTTRVDSASVARRIVTARFWESCRPRCSAFVSEAVIGELEAGVWEGQSEALAAVALLPRLPVTPAVVQAARTYVDARLMPAEARGDAFHLALASVHAMEALITWNVRHLANSAKVRHLQTVNRRLGLPTPTICTPSAFMEGFDA